MMLHRKLKEHCILIGILFFVLIQPSISMAYEKEILELSGVMAEEITKANKSRIAVVDFTDLRGTVTELGRFIAEEFSVALLNRGNGFEVVDRTHLQTLIKEHKLSSTGLIDPATAQKLGQIAGVEALITGSITPFGETVRLSVKMLDVKTAKLISANSANIPATEAIKSLLESNIQGGSNSKNKTNKGISRSSLKSQQVIKSNGFTFELQKCERSSATITVHFMITNNRDDRELQLSTKDVRMFDDNGNEYYARKIKLGKQTIFFRNRCDLVNSIPVRAYVRFEKVSSKASYLKLLEINWRSDTRFITQFRDVEFSE